MGIAAILRDDPGSTTTASTLQSDVESVVTLGFHYEMFYRAASSSALTAVNADHTMFEDPNSCTFCELCTAGTANAATVLATSVTTFFAKVLLHDTSVDATLDTTALVAAGTVTVESK